MMTFLDCWVRVATDLFAQALAGEPELADSLPRPFSEGAFGFRAALTGEVEGRFTILIDGAILEAPLLGEGADQRAGWAELIRESLDAAAGELLAKGGAKCRVESFEPVDGQSQITRAFVLRAGERSWAVQVREELRPASEAVPAQPRPPGADAPAAKLSPGLELLLDVELEASLRFGSREMPLGEILDLGPGDVVQLDRHVADPVDLIVGDRIVARGEVVLVNGNFGLRVTEVAAPQRRLETIRCLF